MCASRRLVLDTRCLRIENGIFFSEIGFSVVEYCRILLITYNKFGRKIAMYYFVFSVLSLPSTNLGCIEVLLRFNRCHYGIMYSCMMFHGDFILWRRSPTRPFVAKVRQLFVTDTTVNGHEFVSFTPNY